MKAAGPCLVTGCQIQIMAGVRQSRPFLNSPRIAPLFTSATNESEGVELGTVEKGVYHDGR